MSDRIDETVPGGRYMGADGVVRDANGKVLKDEGGGRRDEDGFPLETRGNDEPKPTPEPSPEPEPEPEPTPEPKPARKRKAA